MLNSHSKHTVHRAYQRKPNLFQSCTRVLINQETNGAEAARGNLNNPNHVLRIRQVLSKVCGCELLRRRWFFIVRLNQTWVSSGSRQMVVRATNSNAREEREMARKRAVVLRAGIRVWKQCLVVPLLSTSGRKYHSPSPRDICVPDYNIYPPEQPFIVDTQGLNIRYELALCREQ